MSDQVSVSQTALGNVFSGERSGINTTCLVQNVGSDSRMENMLTQYIENEHFGLRPNGEVKLLSDDDRTALDMMEQHTVQRDDGWYETRLLFRKEKSPWINFELKLIRNPS